MGPGRCCDPRASRGSGLRAVAVLDAERSPRCCPNTQRPKPSTGVSGTQRTTRLKQRQKVTGLGREYRVASSQPPPGPHQGVRCRQDRRGAARPVSGPARVLRLLPHRMPPREEGPRQARWPRRLTHAGQVVLTIWAPGRREAGAGRLGWAQQDPWSRGLDATSNTDRGQRTQKARAGGECTNHKLPLSSLESPE